jgi:hypothetical protein
LAALNSKYLLTPYAVSIETGIDITTEESDYLRDYFDEETIRSDALQNATRGYIIYPYLHDRLQIEVSDFA